MFETPFFCFLRTAVILALVITITYKINMDDNANTGDITTTTPASSSPQIDDVISLLVSLDWPLNGEWRISECCKQR
jgi:hypothetical protein